MRSGSRTAVQKRKAARAFEKTLLITRKLRAAFPLFLHAWQQDHLGRRPRTLALDEL